YEPDKVEDLVTRVKLKLHSLYDHYAHKDTLGNVETVNAIQVSQPMVTDEIEEDAATLFAIQYKKHLEEENSIENKSELDRYL
ncbi:hypothetical protein U1Q18_043622, partial [Sarracenia purpurea var. burkii]